MSPFTKAVKKDAKLRLALCGPAGSGKTYSLLALATELGGPVAYVDTEHGSASKYADLFAFDTIEPSSFDPRELIGFIKAAAENGYKVICIDSLSHYWIGHGGELDLVDKAAKQSKSQNTFASWKQVTPIHTDLIDTMIAAPIHVLAAMRTKTEWVVEKDSAGKTVPRKIGLAPVMRDGIEFEFDVCGELDQDNTLVVTKSRCPALSNAVVPKPGKDMAITLKQWLGGAAPAEVKQEVKPEPKAETPVPPPPAASGPVPRTQPAAGPMPATLENKLAASIANTQLSKEKLHSMTAAFLDMKHSIGETEYRTILGRYPDEQALIREEGEAGARQVFKQMVQRERSLKQGAVA
jgi:DNA polymerase III delta prime subunit